jgi:hypothetical protein
MSDRPGRLVKEIVIDEPKPRTEEFQHGTRLAGIAQEVYAELRLAERGVDEGTDDERKSGGRA